MNYDVFPLLKLCDLQNQPEIDSKEAKGIILSALGGLDNEARGSDDEGIADLLREDQSGGASPLAL